MNGTASGSLVVYDHEESVKKMVQISVERYGVSDAILINAHLIERTQSRTAMEGLDLALTLVDDGRPIVIYSVYKEEYCYFVEDGRYHALKGYPHVEFVDILKSVVHVVEAVARARSRKRPEDPLAIALLKLKREEDRMSILKHDFAHANTPDSLVKWLDQARTSGLSGGDSQVIEAVKSWKASTVAPFRGQRFPGIFCDVAGTLLDSKGGLNARLVGYLRAQSEYKPVTLWTGGDVESARKKLSQLVPWKVTSKQYFEGATVEIAIDDTAEDTLKKDYGFNADSFIKAPQDLLDMDLL